METFAQKITNLFLIIGLFVIGTILSIVSLENGLLLSILSFLLIFLFTKKVKIKNFPLFLVIFSLVTKIAAVIILQIPMQSDYYIMYDASLRAIHGDFSFGKAFYFSNWGYQLGHVFYQALMLKIFNHVLFLKILNCVYSTVITLFIYLILKKVTSENTSRMMSLVYAISLYPIYLNTVLGNQPLSLMFILIGIYFLLMKKNNFISLLIAGILIGLGNIERPEGIVYLLTIFIYYILTLKNIKQILKNTAIVVLSAVMVTQLASFILIQSGVSDIGLKNTNPYWKFLLGFNYTYNGKNNLEDDQYGGSQELEKEVLKQRLTDFKKMPNLFYQKIKIQWLYDDLDTSFNATTTTQFSQNIMKIGLNYIKVMNILVLALAFIGVLKQKKDEPIGIFFLINVLIYFGVYLLIETNARYYYNPQIAVILLGGIGLEQIIQWCKTIARESKTFAKRIKIQ